MKKTLGIILSLLLLGLVFLGIGGPQADLTELSVSVSCGDLYGCGTVYDRTKGQLVIVTAGHVLSDHMSDPSKEITVTFSNAETCKAQLLDLNEELDIAFLSVQKKALTGSQGFVLSRFPATANTPLEGDTIYFVDANTKDIYAGSFGSAALYSEDFGMDMIYCYCAVTPGMSGTGLFDKNGHYLGILLGGSNDADAVCLDASTVHSAYHAF